jgi:hypothetical protein
VTEGGGGRTGAQGGRHATRALLRRAAHGLAAAVAIAALTVGGAPAAVATSGDDRITRYEVTVEVDHDGAARVRTVLDVDFGEEPSPGPALTYVTEQRFDDRHDRAYLITDVEATSRTAPHDVHPARRGGLLEVRLGGADADLTGTHTYRLEYRVEGWVSSADALGLERDELVLNVVGDSWTVPVLDLRVSVAAPAAALDARCYAGPDATCLQMVTDGTTATFAEPTLLPGESLTVALAYPAGTFGDVKPILVERGPAARTAALAGVGVVTVGVATAVALRARRPGGRESRQD